MIWAGRLVCASDGGSCEGSADERAVGAHITMGFGVRSRWAASGHTVSGAQKWRGWDSTAVGHDHCAAIEEQQRCRG